MKRLICCLDGTWNEDMARSIPTNVVKLHHSILATDSNGIEQRAFYVTGIATAFTGQKQFWMGAAGLEVGDRIQTAYARLVESYEPGDEISLFGFSRGAFAARSLGGFIALLGIARRDRASSLDEAWKIYRQPARKRDPAKIATLRAAAHYPVRIKCMGLWDTVGNLGNPLFTDPWSNRFFRFHDLGWHGGIDVGLHALSIDECRGPFRPTLWTLKEGASLPANQHIEQVWFAGSHADVGGGYKETELSDITLLWMAERAGATAGIAFDTEELKRTTCPNPLGAQHSPTASGIYRLSALLPFIRLIGQRVEAIPRLRRMILGYWRTGKVASGVVPVNERVHESALMRLGRTVPELKGEAVEKIVYQPDNLVAFVNPSGNPSDGAPPEARSAAARNAPPPKLVTVHGTGAGQPKDAGEIWWQHESAFQKELSKLLDLDSTNAEIVPFHWAQGPNSETGRRRAGEALHGKLKTYDRLGIDYYLLGHSHGGSVIYNALLESVSKGEPFRRLRSWCTVGAPFLDYKPNRFLFTRLSLTSQSIYVSAWGAIVFAIALAWAWAYGTDATVALKNLFQGSEFRYLYLPVLFAFLLYAGAAMLLLFILERVWGGWRTTKQKKEVHRLYANTWLGLWHRDDEAISALANVKSISGPIIPTTFLVPIFAMIPLLVTIWFMSTILFSSAAVLKNPPGVVTKIANPEVLRKLGEMRWYVEPNAHLTEPKYGLAWAVAGGAAGDTDFVAITTQEIQELEPIIKVMERFGISLIAVPFAMIAIILIWQNYWHLAIAGIAFLLVLGTIIFVAITAFAIMVFQVLGGLFGIPLAKAIDNLVWSSVRQQAWGDDKMREGVGGVSSHPALFTSLFTPLPADVADKLNCYSEQYATLTLHRARQILGMTANAKPSGNIGHDLSAQLNWRELIHTCYFDMRECTQLIAMGLNRAGLGRLRAEHWPSATFEQVHGWFKEISTPRLLAIPGEYLDPVTVVPPMALAVVVAAPAPHPEGALAKAS